MAISIDHTDRTSRVVYDLFTVDESPRGVTTDSAVWYWEAGTFLTYKEAKKATAEFDPDTVWVIVETTRKIKGSSANHDDWAAGLVSRIKAKSEAGELEDAANDPR